MIELFYQSSTTNVYVKLDFSGLQLLIQTGLILLQIFIDLWLGSVISINSS